ncbi:hypothetical protein BXZ70DRAFT_906017 [Cristinia sonorae]|uniref:DUF6532 domain-containing protein n=1 Tax=Cristinia sonorae TaxID=1940300 RepID=A0A8K0UU97_9AGAR|nr:hypothetical protein BXZ70DRAFT_906017 [Cristinia sonorae]
MATPRRIPVRQRGGQAADPVEDHDEPAPKARMSKQAALKDKLWMADAPNSRKRGNSNSVHSEPKKSKAQATGTKSKSKTASNRAAMNKEDSGGESNALSANRRVSSSTPTATYSDKRGRTASGRQVIDSDEDDAEFAREQAELERKRQLRLQKANRPSKKAAVTQEDEPMDVDDQSTYQASKKATNRSDQEHPEDAAFVDSDREGDEAEDQGNESNDEEFDNDDGLGGMDARAVKKVLSAELPTWSKDSDDEHSRSVSPDFPTHISRPSVKPLKANKQGKGKHRDNDNDSSLSGTPPPPSTDDGKGLRKSVMKASGARSLSRGGAAAALFDNDDNVEVVRRKPTARQLEKQQQEQPRFRDSDSESEGSVAVVADSDNEPSPPLPADDFNAAWHPSTHVKVTEGKVLLRGQSRLINTVVNNSIEMVAFDLAFTNGCPETDKKGVYIHTIMVGVAASKPETKKIAHRLQNDAVFAKMLTWHPKNRMSTLRGRWARAVWPLLDSLYSLTTVIGVVDEKGRAIKRSQDEIVTRVETLLDGHIYIFPMGPGDKPSPVTNQPFFHPAIHRGIHLLYFSTPDSLGNAYAHELPKYKDVPEVPQAMLAFVATVIYAGLKAWSTGSFLNTNFHVENYVEVYRAHVDIMEESIVKAGVHKYHKMLATVLANSCDSVSRTASGSGHSSRKYAQVDYANMSD